MFKRVIIFLLLSMMTSPLLASLPDVIAQIRPSIVGVGTVLLTRRPPSQLMGTGFVIGNGQYVITNAHVVPEFIDDENREFLAVFVGTGDDAKTRSAKVIKMDSDHDLALLKITGDPLPAMTLGYADDVREGQLLAFTGFPIGAVLGLYPVTHQGIVSAISPVVIPVSSSNQLDVKMIRRLQNPYDIFQLDATAYPGNSGSPLYDQQTGRVVGVINKVFVKETKEKVLENPSGITYAIPVRYIRALLKEADIVF